MQLGKLAVNFYHRIMTNKAFALVLRSLQSTGFTSRVVCREFFCQVVLICSRKQS